MKKQNNQEQNKQKIHKHKQKQRQSDNAVNNRRDGRKTVQPYNAAFSLQRDTEHL